VVRRTISPQQQRLKRRREDDLRDPHGAGPTQERAKDREEKGELVARLLGGGKDRADLYIRFAIVGEKRRRRRSLVVISEGGER
jgi:hypothetical protein